MAPDTGLVWVTRPQSQAGELVSLLEQAGRNCVAVPVLEIQPLVEPDPALSLADALLASLNNVDHLIFVSANAARLGLARLAALGIDVPERVSIYGVGPSTAEQLLSLHREIKIPQDDFTSEGLLALEPLQQIAGNSVMIVRGVGGRSLLARELAARGAEVRLVELYRRGPPEKLPASLVMGLQGGAIGAIMVASGETLTNLVAMAAPWLADLRQRPLVVPGDRVATIARDQGFTQVRVARSALAQDMLQALLAPPGSR